MATLLTAPAADLISGVMRAHGLDADRYALDVQAGDGGLRLGFVSEAVGVGWQHGVRVCPSDADIRIDVHVDGGRTGLVFEEA